MKYVAATIVCAIVLPISTVAFAQTVMTAADIQQTLGGKRLSLSCIDGTNGSGIYIMGKNFGTIRGVYRLPGLAPVKDVGRVRACAHFQFAVLGQSGPSPKKSQNCDYRFFAL